MRRSRRAAIWAFAVGVTMIVIPALAVREYPALSKLYEQPREATRIYDRNGVLLAVLYREYRQNVPLSEIPKVLQQAVIAMEDQRFYVHPGVDARGMVRAAWRNFRAGQFLEGGSTITQQLARNLFLTRRRAVARKLVEIPLALEIERRLTKDEILELYLNLVYFGEGAFGVEAAAQVYFGKPVSRLTLAESALIAGLIRAPSTSSPFRNLLAARTQQALVLRRMADLGFMSSATASAAAAERLRFAEERSAAAIGARAPYFVSYIVPQLVERFGADLVYGGGLEVYTTLDARLQSTGEWVIRDGIDDAARRGLATIQGALVAIDVPTGQILAMVGGYDYQLSQFNRAWQARRQPGSAFKPFVYTTAVLRGWRPSKMLWDTPVAYPSGGPKPWRPTNYDKRFRGGVTMRQALAQSINVPAIKTLAAIRPARVIDVAHQMGIVSHLEPNLSLALGSSEVTPLEMASAYATLAAGGLRAQPVAVSLVLDRSGRILERYTPRRQAALPPEVACTMNAMLKGVILHGTGRAARIGRPAAGKTGTSDDYRNAWFIGYTLHISSAVWVGNDDNSPIPRVTGGTIPARIWAAFMREATEAHPPDDFDASGCVELDSSHEARRTDSLARPPRDPGLPPR